MTEILVLINKSQPSASNSRWYCHVMQCYHTLHANAFYDVTAGCTSEFQWLWIFGPLPSVKVTAGTLLLRDRSQRDTRRGKGYREWGGGAGVWSQCYGGPALHWRLHLNLSRSPWLSRFFHQRSTDGEEKIAVGDSFVRDPQCQR